MRYDISQPLLALLFFAVFVGFAAAGLLVLRGPLRRAFAGSLCRSVSGYPQPLRGELQAGLKDYVNYVIEKGWPQQRLGIIPQATEEITTSLAPSSA